MQLFDQDLRTRMDNNFDKQESSKVVMGKTIDGLRQHIDRIELVAYLRRPNYCTDMFLVTLLMLCYTHFLEGNG